MKVGHFACLQIANHNVTSVSSDHNAVVKKKLTELIIVTML